MDKGWVPLRASGSCTPENLALTCIYLYRGVLITVAFDQHLVAREIRVAAVHRRGFNLFRFETAFVPQGYHRVSCRDVAKSEGGGTAHACIYHKKNDIIVAYFYHPADPSFGGEVVYDFAGYRDVQQ
jgi:hypothetical protein